MQGASRGAVAVWLLWPGCLESERGAATRLLLAQHDVPLVCLRAAGQATVRDVQRLAAAVAPTGVVPIDTDAPEARQWDVPARELRKGWEWWGIAKPWKPSLSIGGPIKGSTAVQGVFRILAQTELG